MLHIGWEGWLMSIIQTLYHLIPHPLPTCEVRTGDARSRTRAPLKGSFVLSKDEVILLPETHRTSRFPAWSQTSPKECAYVSLCVHMWMTFKHKCLCKHLHVNGVDLNICVSLCWCQHLYIHMYVHTCNYLWNLNITGVPNGLPSGPQPKGK
jgi:hypothetical protein